MASLSSTAPPPLAVLLSGFAPFGGAERNESWAAVRHAAALLREDPGLRVAVRELPVEFGRAGDLLLQAVRAESPQLVIAVGLAAGRRAVTPERVAINVQDARIPDNAGAQPVDEPCVVGGPAGWFSTLPIKAMTAAARTAGLPAEVSQTAGTYVCNDVFFRLQHALGTEGALAGVRGGFVHVPAEQELAAEESGRALALMVRAALARTGDVRESGGREA